MPPRLNQSKIDSILELDAEGLRPCDIARTLDVSYPAVMKYTKTREQKRGPRPRPPAARSDTRSYTQRFFGDPLPGRSALDKRKPGK